MKRKKEMQQKSCLYLKGKTEIVGGEMMDGATKKIN
jgi:hypothetical protein